MPTIQIPTGVSQVAAIWKDPGLFFEMPLAFELMDEPPSQLLVSFPVHISESQASLAILTFYSPPSFLVGILLSRLSNPLLPARGP